MAIKHTKIDGVVVGYLGSLDDHSLLIVVGRSNYRKSSSSLDSIIRDIHKQGLSVCWFETKAIQTAKLLDEKFVNSGVSKYCGNNTFSGNILRKLVKAVILLGQPARWGYFIKVFRYSNYDQANELHKFIKKLFSKEIYLFSHSAGGIVSSRLDQASSVSKIICFGYPFKHPEKPEEPIRTSHLKGIKKPFLIIQGDADEYGTAEDSGRYFLSPSVRVISIKSGHDYDNLASQEYDKGSDAIAKFLSFQ